VGKLLSFDFSIEYKSSATNTMVDALSHRDTDEDNIGGLQAILAPHFDFISRLRHA
jgi:hypothetical protein